MKAIQQVTLVIVTVTVLAAECFAGDLFGGKNQTFSAGVLRHSDHKSLPDLPYSDGDLSYALSWEGHDEGGYWQIAVGYMPDPKGYNDAASYVITPQLNLIFRDGVVCGGIGLLDSYVSADGDLDGWTDPYWQLIAGLRFDMGRSASLAINAYLPFKHFSDIDKEWNSDGVEYGIWLAMTF